MVLLKVTKVNITVTGKNIKIFQIFYFKEAEGGRSRQSLSGFLVEEVECQVEVSIFPLTDPLS